MQAAALLMKTRTSSIGSLKRADGHGGNDRPSTPRASWRTATRTRSGGTRIKPAGILGGAYTKQYTGDVSYSRLLMASTR